MTRRCPSVVRRCPSVRSRRCASALLLAACLPLLYLACGREEEGPAADNETPARAGGAASVGAGAGEKIPADFPSDVPIYPGAETLSAVFYPDRDFGAARLLTDDDLEDVIAWYREKLQEEEWTLGTEESSRGGSRIPAWKADRQLMVRVEQSKSDEHSRITLNVTSG